MSILSDNAIKFAMAGGSIVIEKFDESCLGGNSYDVHLAPTLLVYRRQLTNLYASRPLDCKVDEECFAYPIPDDGFVLERDRLYLGVTDEYTETWEHVPYLDGKSSVGRLGIFTHVTAGRGDVGFCGHWTLEIAVVEPVRIYPHMKIGQLTFHTVEGKVGRSYHTKADAKYAGSRGYQPDPMPVPSRMWRNFR